MIRNVEAYRIFQRHAATDGFLVKPVLIDLSYTEANAALNSPAGFQDLGDWNLHRVAGDTLTEEDARVVARSVVAARLSNLAQTAPNEPLRVGLFSRRMAGAESFALRWDYSDYFDGRKDAAGTFGKIETALVDSASAMAASFGDTTVESTGNASLPLGVLFGAVFSPLAGFKLSWQQGFGGQGKDAWSLSADIDDLQLDVSKTLNDPSSEHIILAMGISANIEQAVAEYLNVNNISYRSAMHVSIASGSVPQGHRLSAGKGLSIVYQAVDAIRQAKDDLGLQRIHLHLFLACPLSMAVLLGQKLNTMSQCILYEHDPSTTPSYHQVHTFNPSGFTYQQ